MADAGHLPRRASVVVVGGGVMGTSIAFHLAEAGVRDVVLLERGALAGGSTSKAAGGVRAQFSQQVNVELGARSLEAFERFSERPGASIDLHQVGYLFLLTRPDDVVAFEAAVQLQNALGVRSRMVGPAEVSRLAPLVSTGDVLVASFHARDGVCSPEAVVQGYAAGARRLGAQVFTGMTVERIVAEAGRVVGVVTHEGVLETDTVVCAAGAWSRALAATAGVDLPVTPLRRQILVTEPLDDRLLALAPSTTPMTIDVATTFYFHREGPGMLLGMSYAGERPGFHLEPDDAWLPDLTAAIERRAPALLDVGIAHGWAGLYEDTPDHDALVGRHSGVDGFLYATGFSGHGFLQGPAVGEVVRDLYLGRPPLIDVSSLRAERFAGQPEGRERHIV